MRLKKLSAFAAIAATAVALSLSGCAPSAGNDNIVSVNSNEPQNPLIPSNTNEVGGGLIEDNIFAGLEYYDASGKAVNDVATSITSTDNKVWDIKLRGDSKFTNGETVTADSFIDAWQYGALLSNAQLNSYYYDAIEGFSYEKDQPLTGLKKVSDTEFTVTLSSPQSDFPLRLGYSGFYPLPKAFLDIVKPVEKQILDANKITDVKKQSKTKLSLATALKTAIAPFGENPIGNGPYKLAKKGAWKHNVQIDLVRNGDYNGPRKALNGGLKIVFYATLDAAYADLLADNLDVLAGIPDASLKNFKSDLGNRAVLQGAAVFQSFTIPARDPHFSGAEGKLRRAAISMAIDRPTLIDKIFSGTRKPAKDFTSPVIDGWSDKLAGADVLTYNPTKAKELWAQADKISPWSGTFELGYNADGGHQGWVDAVTNDIKNTLGIKAAGHAYPTFAEFRTAITDKSIMTAFRTGWQADYPALANFLIPLYQTGAGANDGQYSNPAVDALLTKGNEAKTLTEANKYYQQAQEILLQDLPAIPMWYGITDGGYSTKVSNVKFGWNSVPILYNIVKK